MSTTMVTYCQGQRKDGSPCPNPATQQYVTQLGTRVLVCGTHLRMLKRTTRDEEKLASWGVTPPVVPSPGQTTPVASPDPSPPLPVDG